MPERFICQCFYDDIVSPTLHSLLDRHDPYFEPAPTKLAAWPSCVRPTVEDNDDEGSTFQDEPPLLNFSLSQSAIELPSGTVHVPISSTLSSVPERISESTAATPNITASDSESPLLRCPAAEVGTVLYTSSQLCSLNQGNELILFVQNNAQKPSTRPTDRAKSHSCVKKKVKGKKRARDTSETGEDNGNGRRQTKRKKGKASTHGAGNSGVLPQTQNGHVTDKTSRDSDGTRSLQRRVLEDITNKVLHAVT